MGFDLIRFFSILVRNPTGGIDSTESSRTRTEDSLYRHLPYRFRNEKLLRQALTHRSFFQKTEEHWLSNERLELLGDAVLGMIITETLYRQYPRKREGELTRMKSLMVSRDVLAREAEKLELGKYLILGNGENQSGGRHRRSILADTFEALLGAVYLDGGLEPAKQFVHDCLYLDMSRFMKDESSGNYKSVLLEYMQGQGRGVPKYRVVRESGPDHKKEFTVEVMIRGEVLGTGKGHSKKNAEQKAASMAVRTLGLLIQGMNT